MSKSPKRSAVSLASAAGRFYCDTIIPSQPVPRHSSADLHEPVRRPSVKVATITRSLFPLHYNNKKVSPDSPLVSSKATHSVTAPQAVSFVSDQDFSLRKTAHIINAIPPPTVSAESF
ncbi:hypothetical protein C2857_005672 [Epichloe festucae Fl1]|uniref:Uncharacterized protein n=1 Tax=Epichloe festucae (strain Fl1) TaxID=877507 RepID=A0A7S9KPQ4_EPIFF|nr:hypothetical protein C2857_005672 [Epichloe festucae Fl1]